MGTCAGEILRSGEYLPPFEAINALTSSTHYCPCAWRSSLIELREGDHMLRESDKLWNILACPQCGQRLSGVETGALCRHCHTEYGYTNSGSLDLRLKRCKRTELEFDLATPLLPASGFSFIPLAYNSAPEVDFSAMPVPFHLSKNLLSHFPKAKHEDSLVLDLGCGNTVHREVCEHAAFVYVGLDYNAPQATVLGDAHALPFVDACFDFLLSIAVLEHIRFPFVVIREAYRVLKPDCRFIGTVAFLEPFHGDSYYHHTHLGIFNLLQYGGFEVKYVAPSKEWNVLHAQASMALFPRMPRFLSRSLILPLQLLHRLWWRIARVATEKANEQVRIQKTAGSLAFVANKRRA